MILYVDADACPVKAEVEKVATRRGVKVAMVSNGGLRPSDNPLIEMIYVPDGPDEADKWIAERAVAAGIAQVVFDRNGYIYHGRVAAIADGAREGGLEF